MLKHRRRRDDRLSRGFGGGAADAFALAVARAERSARKSISSVRHPPLWRSSPRHAPGDTPQSRCPSDFYVAGRGANLRATLYQATRFFTFPFWQPLRALHPCAQVRRLAEQDAFALPHHPGHVRHPSQTHPIFISLPLWRSSPRLRPHKLRSFIQSFPIVS